jgi:hypothetical protein
MRRRRFERRQDALSRERRCIRDADKIVVPSLAAMLIARCHAKS